MSRVALLLFLILCCTMTSGCIGRIFSLVTPQRTIILRDTTQSANLTVRPPLSIQMNMLKDGRDHKDYVGKVYGNVGNYVTDLKLEGGRTLEEKLRFLIADSLSRDGYDVSFVTNPKADIVVSGTIHQFEIKESSDAPLFDDKKSNLVNRNIKTSTGSVSIDLIICSKRKNKCEEKELHLYKPKRHLTAQELATELTASIITEAKSIITMPQQ